MFTDKTVVGSQKLFTPSNLLEYMESLLKEAKKAQTRDTENSNYSWLRSRNIESNFKNGELEEFKPIVYKMSSELCALTAVKLDSVVENAKMPGEVLAAIKNVLEEQQNAILLVGAVESAKRRKKANKVHPELLPPGRQPTVSFILNETNKL